MSCNIWGICRAYTDMAQGLMNTCPALDAWWPNVQEPWKVAPDVFFILLGNKKLALHSKVAQHSCSEGCIPDVLLSLFHFFFPAYCPFMGGFCLVGWFFPPYRNTESLETIYKGILSDHVKPKLVLCYSFISIHRLY